MTRLAIIGLSHHTAPVEVREGVALTGDALRAELARLSAAGQEAMVVSTCNRFELYAAVPDADGADDRALERVEALLLTRAPQARPYLYRLAGEAALRHLLRVASSLDSLVVGEPQILGQVKDAFEAAQAVGCAGPYLSRLLPRAFAVAKRVRSQTAIGRNSASVASVAVALAGSVFGSLRGHPVLVVGAGKMAELAARHLMQAEVTDLRVVNRTRARADALAQKLGGTAHDFWELEAQLCQAAVVLCSTGAQEPVLRHDLVARAMKARRGRWLLLLDIAVPRDVDPKVAELENVYLYDIDALQAVLANNLKERQREAEAAERIVAEELRELLQGERALGVVPTIKLLRERAQEAARKEVERTLPRLSAGVTEKDRQLVAQMADAIVNKLLHGPLTALKKDAAAAAGPGGGIEEGALPPGSLVAAVRALWSLSPRDEAEASAGPAPPAKRASEG